MKSLLVADLFCGAGGSSTGAERAVRAIGKTMTLVCVNHWPVNVPLGTVTTKRGTAIVNPFMVQFDQSGSNGGCVRTVEKPTMTIITKQNTALVNPVIEQAAKNVDARRLIMIDGQPYYLDIKFRMLENDELSRAMSFSTDEFTYEFCGTKSDVTRQIGNAVPCGLAGALVKAILE